MLTVFITVGQLVFQMTWRIATFGMAPTASLKQTGAPTVDGSGQHQNQEPLPQRRLDIRGFIPLWWTNYPRQSVWKRFSKACAMWLSAAASSAKLQEQACHFSDDPVAWF